MSFRRKLSRRTGSDPFGPVQINDEVEHIRSWAPGPEKMFIASGDRVLFDYCTSGDELLNVEVEEFVDDDDLVNDPENIREALSFRLFELCADLPENGGFVDLAVDIVTDYVGNCLTGPNADVITFEVTNIGDEPVRLF